MAIDFPRQSVYNLYYNEIPALCRRRKTNGKTDFATETHRGNACCRRTSYSSVSAHPRNGERRQLGPAVALAGAGELHDKLP